MNKQVKQQLAELEIGKQAHGIKRRGKNTWLIYVSAGLDDKGDQVREYRTVEGTPEDAWTERTRLTANGPGQRATKRTRETVGDYLDEWLHDRRHNPEKLDRKPARAATCARYEGLVRMYVKPARVEIGKRRTVPFGQVLLEQVTPNHLRTVLAQMREKGVSRRSAQQCRAVLSVAFADAVYGDRMTVNPCRAVKAGADRPDITPPSTKAIERLLAIARPTRYWLPLVLALYTGLRRGEILGAKWTAIDFDRGSLYVGSNLQRGQETLANGKTRQTLELVDPKTELSKRTVFLEPFVVAALTAQKAAQDARRLKAGEAWQGVELKPDGKVTPSKWADIVFDGGDGGPMDPGAFSHAFKNMAKKAGIPDARLHDLRHAFATAQLDQGTDLATVAAVLGHSDPAFTARQYQHVSDAMRKKAAQAAAQVFGFAQ